MRLRVGIILFIIFTSTASAQNKGGKGKQRRRCGGGLVKSLGDFTTCLNQTIDLSSKLQSVDQCLDSRIQRLQATSENESKKDKKSKPRKTEKIKKMCKMDCEWISAGLIPESNNGSTYEMPVSNIDAFLGLFPQEAREGMKSGFETCFKNTKADSPKEKKNPMQKIKQACKSNKKLIKCLQKTMRQNCRCSTPPVEPTTPASGQMDGVSPNPTDSPRTPENRDSDIESDDDKDDDDEESPEDATTSTANLDGKTSTPSTVVDTSNPTT